MPQKIDLNISLKERNDRIAGKNRQLFNKHGLRVLNLIGSPGCGKTALLEKTAETLGRKLAVIEGDIRTALDTDRLLKHGCQAVQIETGGGCHLNAEMVGKAFKKIDPAVAEILIIENVGNLVCPAAFDLGEHAKVAMLSLPEGDEKAAKYPALFMRSGAVIINKIDLMPVMDYNIERVKSDCSKLNPSAHIFEISAKTGKGIDGWINFLKGQ